jgi:maleylacetate reductase
MHVPSHSAAAAAAVQELQNADVCVAVGGGSAIGLAKAAALTTSVPIIAIPTTYAGSEMTPIWGVTEGHRKTTGRDSKVLPVSVLYDPTLTTTLPKAATITSSVNAMAHAVEALYAPDRSPIVTLMAEESIKTMLTVLPAFAGNPGDLDLRSELLRASWLAGACLGATTMGLHHKLCHILGGLRNLPHAPMHTVLLPYVLDYNSAALGTDSSAALARATGSAQAAGAIQTMVRLLNGPTDLASLGARPDDVAPVVAHALSAGYANPREADKCSLTELLFAAVKGRPLGGYSDQYSGCESRRCT